MIFNYNFIKKLLFILLFLIKNTIKEGIVINDELIGKRFHCFFHFFTYLNNVLHTLYIFFTFLNLKNYCIQLRKKLYKLELMSIFVKIFP